MTTIFKYFIFEKYGCLDTNARGCCMHVFLIPEPTARSAVPGVSPGRGLLIPLGYLHPGKCEHSEVQSHPPLCNGRSTLDGFRRYAHARVQAESGLVSIKLVIG